MHQRDVLVQTLLYLPISQLAALMIQCPHYANILESFVRQHGLTVQCFQLSLAIFRITKEDT